MAASTERVVSSRWKRENCNRTKHDSAFSDWKVLIGPSDWEDHSLGKEGAERYRVHNLPNCSSCSGLYELGIAVPRFCSGRETSKLDPVHIIPVYLGQAENVRTRLQRYGREGAHLENGKSFGEANDSVRQGLGLFSEIFSRGYSVVYRWAPVKNKRDAEATEAQLLNTFDYAWNKGSNGVRRPNEILQKIDRSTSHKTLFPAVARKLLTFHQKEMGIRIESCKPFQLENSSTYSDQTNNNFLSQILKIGRSQPRVVSVRYDFNEHHSSFCGVALGHGSVCRRVPVEGRKRCAEHKGMKLNGFTSKLIAEKKSSIDEGDNCALRNDSFPICGVVLDDGTTCRREPVHRRKRCEEHKGRKITWSLSIPRTESKQGVSPETPKSHELLRSPVLSETPFSDKMETICGVNLKDGTFCRRRPVIGRKRCEEHKGMRIIVSNHKTPVSDKMETICGVNLKDGTFCRRRPVIGRKRCEEHKGMRIIVSSY
ncbi:effector of transcription2 [Actinidia rufa]|uniref:Effector of transcription2 n=1 Tax=Actinidia rufa TaxID=165716 RepID=A0A7J0DVE2_9ERIC|nr:effector of transcription2 [Actinidia rufa]